jgi:nucleotide-binding universal stress UspA family protein
MLFSKILLAYDGSKAANQALERAIELAKVTPGSSLYVVHAFEFPPFLQDNLYVLGSPQST